MRQFLYLCLFCLLAIPSHANDKQDLKKVEAALQAEKTRAHQLEVQQQDIQNKLDRLRHELVSMAKEVQLRERAMVKLTSRVDALEKDMLQEQQNLEQQRESMAHVLMALQRLSRMSSQALLLRPTRPIDTARSYKILGQVIPQVKASADSIKATLEKMKELQQELTQQKTDLEQERAGLETRQAKLQKTVNQRQALLKQTRSSAQKASKKVQALANQAKDLRELLTGIQKTEAIPKIVAGWKDKVSTWFSGSATMPVAGQVKTAYGQVIDGGDKSQGLTISAMGGSIVVSPGSGTVRFAGPFRQYKLLVIIQHANGEHSLLGGLQEIYTRVGDTVVSGEPIGKLTGKLSGDRAALSSLYYERRRHGKPIDPRQARG